MHTLYSCLTHHHYLFLLSLNAFVTWLTWSHKSRQSVLQRMSANIFVFKILHSYLKKDGIVRMFYISFLYWTPTMSKTHFISENTEERREYQFWGKFRIFCTFSETKNKWKSFNLYSSAELDLNFWNVTVVQFLRCYCGKVKFS